MIPKSLILTTLTALFLVSATLLAILWARGYRPDIREKKLKSTGMLVANSFPTGAQVYLNDQLYTATNNTLNLPPGEYKVKIIKDGYIPWEKTLQLTAELVTQTNALLLPAASSLEALTFTGALNPIPSPDGQKIAFTVASASAQTKNGLYVLRLGANPLSFKAETQQIAAAGNFDFLKAKFLWSPDSSQILVYSLDNQETFITRAFLLQADRFNPEPYLEQTLGLELLLTDWEKEVKAITQENFKRLPEALQTILSQSATNLYWSPTKEKVLYTATASATIAEHLIPPLPAVSTQAENRRLEPGKVYVYDLKEDKNFEVGLNKEWLKTAEPKKKNNQNEPSANSSKTIINNLTALYSPIFSQAYQWFPDSQHLIVSEENKILIKEYEGTNETTVYTGPLKNLIDNFAFVFPWPDGSKLVILTSLNKDLPPNLYGIKIK